MRSDTGYTLIELLLALAIVAILVGVALPGVSGAVEASRSATAEADLLASLTRSIQRAAITGTRSVLCPSADGASCRDDADWSAGWIAFLDINANRERDPDDRLLLAQAALPDSVRLRSSVGRTRIVFQGNGGNPGSNVTFTLCDGRGASHARTLVLSNAGRLRHGEPSATGIAATCVH